MGIGGGEDVELSDRSKVILSLFFFLLLGVEEWIVAG